MLTHTHDWASQEVCWFMVYFFLSVLLLATSQYHFMTLLTL